MERSDCFVSFISIYEDEQGNLQGFVEYVTETSKVSTTLAPEQLGDYITKLSKAHRIVKAPTLTMQDVWGL